MSGFVYRCKKGLEDFCTLKRVYGGSEKVRTKIKNVKKKLVANKVL